MAAAQRKQMSPKKASKSNKGKATNPKLSKDEKDDILIYSNGRLIYIAFILKYFSSESEPMNAGSIAKTLAIKFRAYRHNPDDLTRTISNNLKAYKRIKELALQGKDASAGPFSFNIFTSMIGGTIESKKNGGETSYYFQPILDESDVITIEASLLTNRDIDEQSKDYLIKTLDSLLRPYDELSEIGHSEKMINTKDILQKISSFKDALKEKRDKILPKQSSDNTVNINYCSNIYLNHVYLLNWAIRNKYQVEVNYGHFDMEKTLNNNKYTLTKEKNNRILNPYALISNQGHMYLIATNVDNTELPLHFRIDRMMSVALHRENDFDDKDSFGEGIDKTYKVEFDVNSDVALTDPMPEVLEQYFDGDFFNSMRYLSEHPMMGAYKKDARIIKKTILITDRFGIALCHDFFGDHVTKISKELKPDNKPRVSKNNLRQKKEILYQIVIENVYEDNMLLFLSHHHNMLKVIRPSEIKKQHYEALKKSILQYCKKQVDKNENKTE